MHTDEDARACDRTNSAGHTLHYSTDLQTAVQLKEMQQYANKGKEEVNMEEEGQ